MGAKTQRREEKSKPFQKKKTASSIQCCQPFSEHSVNGVDDETKTTKAFPVSSPTHLFSLFPSRLCVFALIICGSLIESLNSS